MHVFGWWEEAGAPRDNPSMHRENIRNQKKTTHDISNRIIVSLTKTKPTFRKNVRKE